MFGACLQWLSYYKLGIQLCFEVFQKLLGNSIECNWTLGEVGLVHIGTVF